jgi:hypothetical protein
LEQQEQQQAQVPQFTPEEKLAILRGGHLSSVLQHPGWAFVMEISQAIVNEALGQLDAYEGTSEHEIAVLAFIWKTVKAHQSKLLATIKDRIETAQEVAAAKVRPEHIAKPATETDSALAFPVVKPACDVE